MQGACIVTAFAPKALFLLQALQKSQVGFLVSLYLLVQNLPQVPYSFIVFCRSRSGVSRCKHCSAAAEGPGSQPVSGAGVLVTARQGSPLNPCSWEWVGLGCSFLPWCLATVGHFFF